MVKAWKASGTYWALYISSYRVRPQFILSSMCSIIIYHNARARVHISTLPSNTLPFWAVSCILWAGHASHIFPLKQPYFYTHVESLWCPWNEPYNLITMWKKNVFLFCCLVMHCFSVIVIPSSSSLCFWLYRLALKLSQFEQSWVCSISVHVESLSLFFWSPFFPSFFCCILPDMHGTHRDSQWHNYLSGLFLIPFPIFSNNLSGIFFYCLWLISLNLHTHNEWGSLCWAVIAKLKHLTVYA